MKKRKAYYIDNPTLPNTHDDQVFLMTKKEARKKNAELKQQNAPGRFRRIDKEGTQATDQ